MVFIFYFICNFINLIIHDFTCHVSRDNTEIDRHHINQQVKNRKSASQIQPYRERRIFFPQRQRCSDCFMLNTGDSAFVLVSSALVLIMTPGLAFFYGGMVRRKNVLSTMMASFFIMGLASVLWCLWAIPSHSEATSAE